MPNSASKQLWIAIGDIHENIENLAKIPELSEAAGIIVSGDLTNCGDAEQADKVMAAIKKCGLPVYAQIGNMDLSDVNEWLEKSGHNLHTHAYQLAPDMMIFGIGGSNITPMNTPSEFTEDAYRHWLEALWDEAASASSKVLISHSPPKDTICDDIGGEIHVGSPAVRGFIEKHQPDICICGHIHEGKGTDRIGKTVIINPGMLAEGGYAILRYDNGKISAELAQVQA